MRIISYILVLIVVIYAGLIIVPGRDHTVTDAAPLGTEGPRDFFTNLLSFAEEEARTPRGDPPVIVARADRLLASGALVEEDGVLRMQTADGEWIEIAAVIDPADLIPRTPEDAPIATVEVGSGEPVADVEAETGETDVAAVQPVAVQTPILWRVTGTRVNFRAGPTTDSAILTALLQGDLVEYLGDGPDGWARLRVPSTGIEGYMSVDFLEPAN